MEEHPLANTENSGALEVQMQQINSFLKTMGLPASNIIANQTERNHINRNLPEYIFNLPQDIKTDAVYLSKFVVGAGFGLFDYSLNSIWNEVILSLRQKAIAYGLDIFFDKAIGGKLRAEFSKEEDLAFLKDNVMLNTMKSLELISDTTYKKLAHILDMRNDIGISHPTEANINAFELLGWLQICIQDVLQDKPSPAAIQVKAFIDNLKTSSALISNETAETIKIQIKSLATNNCDVLLRTMFGIYVAPETDQVVRKNISMLSTTVWDCSSDEQKYRLGIIMEGYNNNMHQNKYRTAETFFNTVNGNNFRTKNEKVVALSALNDRLYDAHYAWDNFYNEAPIIERIMTYFEKSTEIPSEIVDGLIHTILLCRIGRGLSHNSGVSPGGKVYYDLFFKSLREEHFPKLVSKLADFETLRKLEKPIAKNQCIEMLKLVKQNLINDKYIETIDYLIDQMPNPRFNILNKEFKKITASFLTWPDK